jgi:hypothetical protein
MSDVSRRDVFKQLAAAFAGVAIFDPVLAREAHAFVQQPAARSAAYVPKALTIDEFRTLERLTDLIIPVENGKPGALAAGVPAWIDSLLDVSAALQARYTDGMAWLNKTMRSQSGRNFANAAPDQQTALLDLIAFKKNASPELDPGIQFFALARRMTVDGFYTSDAGIRDLIPQGRPPRGQFVVPQESIDYVISRSPFK